MKIKKSILIPVIAVIVLLAIYFGGVFYFSSHLLPNTTINGSQYGNKTTEQAIAGLQLMENETMILQGKDNAIESLELVRVDYQKQIDPAKIEAIVKEQSPYLWFLEFPKEKSHEIPLEITYDEAKLKQEIKQLALLSGDIILPENAYIKKTDTAFELIPEVLGNKLDENKLVSSIKNALQSSVKEVDLQENDCYLQPKVTAESESIQKSMEEFESLKSINITYDFGNVQEVLTYEKILPWLEITDSSVLKVDEEQAGAYIQSLAANYNTIHTTRKFKSTHHGEILVGGGIYGFQMNTKESTKSLVEAVVLGESAELKPIYTTYGNRTSDGYNDIGNTYIEIDLTAQTMWLYMDGNLKLETGVVTGLPNTDRETPTGVFQVWSKETKRFISGEDYKLWVEYWIPIDWTGVGIHDASWQSAFGGSNYTVRGSHGCINTPYEQCKIIYDSIETGIPVVIYKS